MQLIIGGAFSGKRKVAKTMMENYSWMSAYDGDVLDNWEAKWVKHTTLVIEGWEKWLACQLRNGEPVDKIRSECNSFFLMLLTEERKRNSNILLIMLEMGRGIVPLQQEDRIIRDLSGWIAQDAAHMSEAVHYVWNGFAKRLK